MTPLVSFPTPTAAQLARVSTLHQMQIKFWWIYIVLLLYIQLVAIETCSAINITWWHPGKIPSKKSKAQVSLYPYHYYIYIYIYTLTLHCVHYKKIRYFTNRIMWQNISSINIEQDCERTRNKCIQLVLFMANSVCRTLNTKIFHTQTFPFTAVWRHRVLFYFLLPSLSTSCSIYEQYLQWRAISEQTWGFEVLEASRFREVRSINVAMLWDLHTSQI